MDDVIYRQGTVNELREYITEPSISDDESEIIGYNDGIELAISVLSTMPSAQPEQPPYVAEIEAEYQKAVKMPHIHKPLAKALYEVWKKHDREDAERRTDG